MEPASPASAAGFFTSEPPGKSSALPFSFSLSSASCVSPGSVGLGHEDDAGGPHYVVWMSSGGFPDSSAGKESTCNAGDLGSIPGQEEPPEKETATHSSIPAWKIPWTEEPGGLQSMELQRVGND